MRYASTSFVMAAALLLTGCSQPPVASGSPPPSQPGQMPSTQRPAPTPQVENPPREEPRNSESVAAKPGPAKPAGAGPKPAGATAPGGSVGNRTTPALPRQPEMGFNRHAAPSMLPPPKADETVSLAYKGED